MDHLMRELQNLINQVEAFQYATRGLDAENNEYVHRRYWERLDELKAEQADKEAGE